MPEDYFDRVSRDPRTKIRLAKSVSVNELWEMREKIAVPHRKKKVRLVEFYESFYDFISMVHGEDYETPYRLVSRAMSGKWNHPYVDYVRGYHHQWESGYSLTSFKRKLHSAIDLYHSIKNEGMRDPLGMIIEDGKTFLYRGYRRLVILKVLGIKTAEVEYAIVYNYSSPKQP